MWSVVLVCTHTILFAKPKQQPLSESSNVARLRGSVVDWRNYCLSQLSERLAYVFYGSPMASLGQTFCRSMAEVKKSFLVESSSQFAAVVAVHTEGTFATVMGAHQVGSSAE